MNQHSNPLISVIIPCHNSADYLAETLDSLLAQTWTNFEVWAIDDASSDNTVEILRQYQQQDNRINIIEQKENTYCVIARQNAIQHATGKYLVCLDSDDKLAPTYLEKCVLVAEQDGSLSIVYTDRVLFDREQGVGNLKEFTVRNFLLDCSIYITALIRKSAFDAVGGFDTSLTLCEDWELFISIIKNGGRVHFIREPLFFYRRRFNHTSATDMADYERTSDNFLKIYIKHYDFYKKNGIYFHELLAGIRNSEQYYYYRYNKWHKKLWYKLFKPKRYQKILDKMNNCFH